MIKKIDAENALIIDDPLYRLFCTQQLFKAVLLTIDKEITITQKYLKEIEKYDVILSQHKTKPLLKIRLVKKEKRDVGRK